MLSAVSIKGIRAKDYDNAVCRLVLDLNQDTDFSVSKHSDGFMVSINGFDGRIPAYELTGTFLDRIEATADGLKITSNQDLSYQTMRLSDAPALVIDFFTQSKTKHDRLAIARFLADKGRLASADSAFHALALDYPQHYDILYYWGKLLIKRGSSRAAEKLALIPPSSSYYYAARQLIGAQDQVQSKENAEQEESIPSQLMPEPLLEEEEIVESQAPQDTIITGIPNSNIYVEKPNFLSTAADIASRNFALTLFLFVAVLVILALLIFGSFKRRKKPTQSNIEESSLNLDTETMCKMVNRLLADGWTNKEIARELKTSVKEIELMVHRLHYMGIHEDDEKS